MCLAVNILLQRQWYKPIFIYMRLFISFIQLKEKEVVSMITVHISASDGTPAVYQGLLGCLQGFPLHTLPVARDAILRLHL